MPILNKDDSTREELSPGVQRWSLVDGKRGSEATSVGDVVLAPGSRVPTHMHPTEEAMVILEGEIDAILGDEVIRVREGQTVLAPPGVKHGFVNRSGAPARIMAIFPTAHMERIPVD